MHPLPIERLSIAIRKEDERKRAERRAPLTPADVRVLLEQQPHLTIYVEKSNGRGFAYERVYSDAEYAEAGAVPLETLDDCGVELGIKEIELHKLRPGKLYCCFSHTFKGQQHNLPLLKRLMRLGCTLVDYEMLVNDVLDEVYYTVPHRTLAPAAFHPRTVYFGKFAGISGIVDCLWAVGQRWARAGQPDNPLATLKKALEYSVAGEPFGTYALAAEAIAAAGEHIRAEGLTDGLTPFIIGIAGKGHTAQGTHQVLDLLPIQEIDPADLATFAPPPEEARHTVYVTTFTRAHTQHGLTPYLPYLTLLMNCITWKGDAPRLVTRADLRALYSEGDPHLVVIGDISGDPGGAVEVSYPTYPDTPVYTYLPDRDSNLDLRWDDVEERKILYDSTCFLGFEGHGPTIMAVTNLPCEFPKDASAAFSTMLRPYVADIAELGMVDEPWEELNVSRPVKRATMLYKGELTPDYAYLKDYLVKNVLVLGAGAVSPAALNHLHRKGYNITLTDANLALAHQRIAALGAGHVVPCAITADTSPEELYDLFHKADCIVSLLPPPLHPVAARAAIYARTPLVTASYLSPEMQSLHEEAVAAGVPILNEMGLDPGIDHMSALEMVLTAHADGGQIESFSSYCGGLPAPGSNHNPLRYKFSWSPAGVIAATTNPATYLADGLPITIAAADLFAAPAPLTVEGWEENGEHFETYPNRNSLPYIDYYAVPEVQNFIRGTIRYAGWGHFFNALRKLGWLNAQPRFAIAASRAAMQAELALESTDPLLDRLDWLLAGQTVLDQETPIAALTRFLVAKPELHYGADEWDMVLMQHRLIVRLPDGRREERTATMRLMCQPVDISAMSLTTGGTIAIGAEAILEGIVTQPGVLIPTDPALCHFALRALEEKDIRFEETVRYLK